MTQHPEVLWAQRSSDSNEEKNVLYVTVNLPDIVEESLQFDLTSTSISFKAKNKGGEKEYAFNIDLFAEVDPENSKKKLTSRSLCLVIRKKESQKEYWPRLTKEGARNRYIKTDFGKWLDEDDQGDVRPADEEDGMDFGGMGGMGGMPGMGGMGGMPGMGGMGGMPGMGGMGGMPGMGDMGGMDFEKMMADLGKGGGAESQPSQGEDDSDDSDAGPPPLEEAEASK